MKPDKPIVYNEFYLDAMTGGSSELPAPVTPEQHYLAHLAGMAVTLPQPIILRDMFLAKICGMDVNVPTYIPGQFPRKFAYYAKAAGQDVDVPQPITREEMYWFDYVSEPPTPTEKEYTGAVPVTFTANGQPLLDYLISGNTVQNGTPTPDSPVMPQGCGERTGNLYSGTDISGSINNAYYKNDFVYANLNQGIYTLAFDLETSATDTYRSSIGVGTTGYSKDIQAQSNKTDGHFVFTFTIEAEDAGKNLYARFARFSTQVTITYTTSNIMLNSGSTPLPYEPYGYKIPISSAGQTNNIYLGEVETTRRIKKYEFTGQENISQGSENFYTSLPTPGMPYSNMYCTHNVDGACSVNNNGGYIWFKISSWSDYATAGELKAFFQQEYAAGTPVTVWYVLATEQTGIVNEPLMKIGEYADTVSKEQASVEIPTARGTNTLDVLTDVKPSEIYIKYKE